MSFVDLDEEVKYSAWSLYVERFTRQGVRTIDYVNWCRHMEEEDYEGIML